MSEIKKIHPDCSIECFDFFLFVKLSLPESGSAKTRPSRLLAMALWQAG